MYKELLKDLSLLKDESQAKHDQKFFKAFPGGYGEGDIFWGIKNPDLRVIIKKYKDLPKNDIFKLLSSEIHEIRFVGLGIIKNRYEKTKDLKEKKEFYDFAMNNRKYINNWDLVDIFSPHIFGAYLFDKEKDILYKLIKSSNLWDRRIAIISTMYFVKRNDYNDAIKLITIALNDKEDLIHKASGWVLREISKKDKNFLLIFLNAYSTIMPRTMLRYSIEKLDLEERKYYLYKK